MENLLVVKNLITHVNCSSQCAAVRMNLSLISTDPQLIFLSSSHIESWRRLTSGISGKTMPGMGDGLNNSSPKTSTSLCLTSSSYKVPQTEKVYYYFILSMLRSDYRHRITIITWQRQEKKCHFMKVHPFGDWQLTPTLNIARILKLYTNFLSTYCVSKIKESSLFLLCAIHFFLIQSYGSSGHIILTKVWTHDIREILSIYNLRRRHNI